MSRQASRFLKFIKNKWVIAGIIILAVIITYAFTRGGAAPTFQATPAAIGDVIERVSVTGTVSPADKAALAFQKSGVITVIAVSVGDTVKKGDLIASLDSAADAAALASAQADLAELQSGLRPQEFAVDQANVSAASTTLANAQKDAVNAVRDSYVKAQSALVNYSDNFFNNPQSPNPTININTQSTNLANSIDTERLMISATLAQWKSDNDTAAVANAAGLITNAEGYLATIKSFMSDLSAIVNALNTGNSGTPQNAIDADVSTMNTALSTLTAAITSVSAADTELKNAQAGYTQANSQFALEEAGSSADTIASQAAKVDQAQAALADDSIVSPIDGIVTQADPNVGEFAAAGESGFAVQSSSTYKIEAYVPEADIAKVALGDLASSTLDAYGSNVDFPAQVTAIDPAETVLEGVPTYKVTLLFVTPDARIRSGMTANLEILTHEVDNVLEIPYRAVMITATSTMVRVVSANGQSYSSVPVTVGLKGSDGTIEIMSGLKEGDRVVTYVK
jgi:RND family efflux transporter MFP subunit